MLRQAAVFQWPFGDDAGVGGNLPSCLTVLVGFWRLFGDFTTVSQLSCLHQQNTNIYFHSIFLFIYAVGITTVLISKAQTALSNTEEFINDPRHPRFAGGDAEHK